VLTDDDPETLAGMLMNELQRAIDRLIAARRDIDEDIAAIEAEIERRRKRRRASSDL
jgi:hypothetical protein